MQTQAQKQASSKEPDIRIYPINPTKGKDAKPKRPADYIGKERGDIAIGKPIPVDGRYSPDMDILPPAPYPGEGRSGMDKAKPGKYAPQGKEFDISQLRKYLEEIMGDTAYIMIPVSKKQLARYRN